MVANKNSPRQKCGDIFLNTKTIKNKAKVYTFHCTLCSMDCDQLKKFSKHLENHLEYFENHIENSAGVQTNNGINLFFEAEEIKVEAESDEHLNENESNISNDYNIPLVSYGDPLETQKLFKTEFTLSNCIKKEYSTEEIENDIKPGIENKSNENVDIIEAAEIFEKTKKNKIVTSSLMPNELCSDNSLECSDDPDFDIEKQLKRSKALKKLKDSDKKTKSNTLASSVKSSEEIFQKKKCSNKTSNCVKPKRRRREILESILPFLLQQYKKYEILWKIDDMAYGIKFKRYEIYTKIAETLRVEKNNIISLEDLNYQINYLNELYSKDKEQELKCEIEGKEFIPEYEHYREMSFLSKSQGPFLCSICNELLPRYHPYCQHIAQHNRTLPYKCPLCDSSFISYYKYLVHKKRHLGILDFHCKICGKGYMFKNDLDWHETSHSGDKPYLCQICGASFRARHHYNSHVRRHEQRFRHECHICKKGFNYLDNLNSHVKSHLNIRDVVCKICGKGFVHSKYLKRHELIHSDEKRYKCNECGKAFFQPSGLRVHRKKYHS